MLPELRRAGCLERARRAWGGRGSARPCMGGGAQHPRILGKSGNISRNTAFPLSAGARNEPREPRPEAPREPQWDRGGGAPRRSELCRYLRHFRLRGMPKRGSRSNREGNFAAICGTCASGARQTGAPARAGGKSARNRGEMAREGALFPERSPVFLAVSGEERRFGPRGSLNATGTHGFSGPN